MGQKGNLVEGMVWQGFLGNCLCPRITTRHRQLKRKLPNVHRIPPCLSLLLGPLIVAGFSGRRRRRRRRRRRDCNAGAWSMKRRRKPGRLWSFHGLPFCFLRLLSLPAPGHPPKPAATEEIPARIAQHRSSLLQHTRFRGCIFFILFSHAKLFRPPFDQSLSSNDSRNRSEHELLGQFGTCLLI